MIDLVGTTVSSWSDLQLQLLQQQDPNWLDKKLKEQLIDISRRRGAAHRYLLRIGFSVKGLR